MERNLFSARVEKAMVIYNRARIDNFMHCDSVEIARMVVDDNLTYEQACDAQNDCICEREYAFVSYQEIL